jgi:hypothetical protein
MIGTQRNAEKSGSGGWKKKAVDNRGVPEIAVLPVLLRCESVE